MLQDRRNKFFVLFASEILICIIVGLAMAFVDTLNVRKRT